MASTSLVKLREQVTSLKHRLTGEKAKRVGKRGVKALIDAGIIGGAAGIMGVVQGRYGAVKWPHTEIPVDLTLAAALYGVGVMEPAGDNMTHALFMAAHGIVASHTTAMGRGAGKRLRVKAGKTPLVEGKQDADLAALMEGASGGGTLSDDDLIALAKRV